MTSVWKNRCSTGPFQGTAREAGTEVVVTEVVVAAVTLVGETIGGNGLR